MAIYRMPVTCTDPRVGKCVNVWHFRTTSVGDVTVETTAVNAAVAAIRTFYGALITSFPTGNTFTADFAINQETNADRAVTWAAVNGSSTGSVAPPHLAVCVNWKTGTRARRARGRTFLGPLGANTLDADGTVHTATLQSVKAAADALITASSGANGWAVGVYGLQDPAPKGQTTGLEDLPHVLRDITGHSEADRFAVMRSRRPR